MSNYIVVDSSGEDEKPKKIKKDTSYIKIFLLWGQYPLNWKMNRTEIESAKNLLTEHSFEEIEKMLAFSKICLDQEYCPQVRKPSDLDRKWHQLVAAQKKQVKLQGKIKSYGVSHRV